MSSSGGGGGLQSFNGRTAPAVVPTTGDYTAAEVGALPESGASCRLYQTTAQGNLVSGSYTTVALDTLDYSVGTITHSLSAYSITIDVDGTYLVVGSVGVNSSLPTVVQMSIYVGATAVMDLSIPGGSSAGDVLRIVDLVRLVVGDVLTLGVFQLSGSTVGTAAGTSHTSLAATLVSL